MVRSGGVGELAAVKADAASFRSRALERILRLEEALTAPPSSHKDAERAEELARQVTGLQKALEIQCRENESLRLQLAALSPGKRGAGIALATATAEYPPSYATSSTSETQAASSTGPHSPDSEASQGRAAPFKHNDAPCTKPPTSPCVRRPAHAPLPPPPAGGRATDSSETTLMSGSEELDPDDVCPDTPPARTHENHPRARTAIHTEKRVHSPIGRPSFAQVPPPPSPSPSPGVDSLSRVSCAGSSSCPQPLLEEFDPEAEAEGGGGGVVLFTKEDVLAGMGRVSRDQRVSAWLEDAVRVARLQKAMQEKGARLRERMETRFER